MSDLQTQYHFNLDFQKLDQHTGGKWLIYGIKQHKDNQLRSLELLVENLDIDGLVQERRNSIANALELRLTCTKPPIWHKGVRM